MLYDCENIIYRTLLSYKDKVDVFWLFIDNKSNKETINEVCRFKEENKNEKINISFFTFTTFDESRNYCLDNIDKTDGYIFFTDDSYILQGSLLELRVYNLEFLNIMVKDDYLEYRRPLIFKNNRGYRYKNKIHEIIPESSWYDKVINNAFIYDYKDDKSIQRSLTRCEYMIENTTSIHYKSMGYLQLLLMNKIDMTTFKENFNCGCKSCSVLLKEYFVL